MITALCIAILCLLFLIMALAKAVSYALASQRHLINAFIYRTVYNDNVHKVLLERIKELEKQS